MFFSSYCLLTHLLFAKFLKRESMNSESLLAHLSIIFMLCHPNPLKSYWMLFSVHVHDASTAVDAALHFDFWDSTVFLHLLAAYHLPSRSLFIPHTLMVASLEFRSHHSSTHVLFYSIHPHPLFPSDHFPLLLIYRTNC